MTEPYPETEDGRQDREADPDAVKPGEPDEQQEVDDDGGGER